MSERYEVRERPKGADKIEYGVWDTKENCWLAGVNFYESRVKTSRQAVKANKADKR